MIGPAGYIVMAIRSIGFDADDTLWHDARDFNAADGHLHELIARHVDPAEFRVEMAALHVHNLDSYGYGVNGYMLSMLEVMLSRFDGAIPSSVAREVFSVGRSLLHREVELLAGVEAALSSLDGRVERVLVTKGDLLHQHRKLGLSGLAAHFDRIEVVSQKTPDTYRRIFGPQDADDPAAAMIGNSVRSDILPALAAGLWALHIPHDLTWDHEDAPPPVDNARYRHFESFADAIGWLRDRI